MANRKTFTHGSKVVEVLNEWLDSKPDLSFIEVAERIGVTKSANCFISQIRAGRVRLPIAKVIPLAKVLEQDPRVMLEVMLDEYYPELRDTLLEGGLLVTDQADQPVDLRSMKKAEKKAS